MNDEGSKSVAGSSSIVLVTKFTAVHTVLATYGVALPFVSVYCFGFGVNTTLMRYLGSLFFVMLAPYSTSAGPG